MLTLLRSIKKNPSGLKKKSLKRRGNKKLNFTARLPEIHVTSVVLSTWNLGRRTITSFTLRYIANLVQAAVQYRDVYLIML